MTRYGPDPVPHRLPDRVLHAVHAQFHQGAALRADRGARVEGVSEWKIFWYIVLPLMRPAIAALSVLIFTFIWNDYFWATVLTQGADDAQPVTAGVLAERPVRSRSGT
jgi:ABC-type glycerol-3-phosphate transport system permease component